MASCTGMGREVRKRRKMNHINIADSNVESVKARVGKVLSIFISQTV